MAGVTAVLPPGTAAKLKKHVDVATSNFEKLQRAKDRMDASAIDSFLAAPFVFPDMLTNPQSNSDTVPQKQTSVSGVHAQLAAIRRKSDDNKREIEELNAKLQVLSDERKLLLTEQQATVRTNESLTEQLINSKALIDNLSKEIDRKYAELRTMQKENASLKKHNLLRRNARLAHRVKTLKSQVTPLQQTLHLSKMQKRRLTNKKAHLKRQFNKKIDLSKQKRQLEVENRRL